MKTTTPAFIKLSNGVGIELLNVDKSKATAVALIEKYIKFHNMTHPDEPDIIYQFDKHFHLKYNENDPNDLGSYINDIFSPNIFDVDSVELLVDELIYSKKGFHYLVNKEKKSEIIKELFTIMVNDVIVGLKLSVWLLYADVYMYRKHKKFDYNTAVTECVDVLLDKTSNMYSRIKHRKIDIDKAVEMAMDTMYVYKQPPTSESTYRQALSATYMLGMAFGYISEYIEEKENE